MDKAKLILEFLGETENTDVFIEYMLNDTGLTVDDIADNFWEEELEGYCDEDEIRIMALALHLEEDCWEDVKNRYEDEDYLVLTDDEADDKWDEELEYYIDEIIIPELPENAQRYFDRESWKNDAKYDGRGHSLGRYDGNEYECTPFEETTYYIFRQN